MRLRRLAGMERDVVAELEAVRAEIARLQAMMMKATPRRHRAGNG